MQPARLGRVAEQRERRREAQAGADRHHDEQGHDHPQRVVVQDGQAGGADHMPIT